MSEEQHKELGKVLWSIADRLRGAMNADDFRDYMLSFLFLRYLSDRYEDAAKQELGGDYPPDSVAGAPLQHWYENNAGDIEEFEGAMRRRAHYTIEPQYRAIAHMAARQDKELICTLENGFRHIEEESFTSAFEGLFSEINLNSDKLGKNAAERNERLCKIIGEIAARLNEFSTSSDSLGNAYEYLIGQFAAGSGKKAGEFYTPQKISTILSRIVALDGQDPTTGAKESMEYVLDFACGSGSLLLNVRRQFRQRGIGKIYGQESNITTYNLARMNMLLHGVQYSEFEIFHGDTLKNDWKLLEEDNPAQRLYFDAVVANPPFSLRWDPKSDVRFKRYGVAPKSASDFAFLLVTGHVGVSWLASGSG